MELPSFANYFLFCLIVSATFVFFLFGRSVKSITGRFETSLSLSETISRLSNLCVTYYDPFNPPLLLIVGSVSQYHVRLECWTRGQRGPLAEFAGTFRKEGMQVVLEGTFHIKFTTKVLYSLLYALCISIGCWSVYDFVINHNQRVVEALIPVCGMAWFGVSVAKSKTEDSLSDWKWLASSISGALVNFNPTPETIQGVAAKDEALHNPKHS